MNKLELMNVNVYMTNVLLIPPVIFIILILKNIHKWKEKPNLIIQQFYFLCFWYILLAIFIVGIVLSFMYHYYMFEDRPLINKISKLDVQISAPLLSILCGLLFILYYLYLNHPHSEIVPSIKYITTPIFFTALCFTFIGATTYIVRTIFFPNLYCKQENEYDSMCGLCSHIFFHYTTYTGCILLLLLYYIEIRPIFLAFFQTENICTDIQKIE